MLKNLKKNNFLFKLGFTCTKILDNNPLRYRIIDLIDLDGLKQPSYQLGRHAATTLAVVVVRAPLLELGAGLRERVVVHGEAVALRVPIQIELEVVGADYDLVALGTRQRVLHRHVVAHVLDEVVGVLDVGAGVGERPQQRKKCHFKFEPHFSCFVGILTAGL